MEPNVFTFAINKHDDGERPSNIAFEFLYECIINSSCWLHGNFVFKTNVQRKDLDFDS